MFRTVVKAEGLRPLWQEKRARLLHSVTVVLFSRFVVVALAASLVASSPMATKTPKLPPRPFRRVVALYDVLQHREIELVKSRNRTWIIGRSGKCDIQVVDSFASSKHCEIAFKNGRFTLRDLDSSNGTLLDQRPVSGEVVLQPDMYIMLGKAELIVLGEDRRLPLTARSTKSFKQRAGKYYGSTRRAGKGIGETHVQIWRAQKEAEQGCSTPL